MNPEQAPVRRIEQLEKYQTPPDMPPGLDPDGIIARHWFGVLLGPALDGVADG